MKQNGFKIRFDKGIPGEHELLVFTCKIAFVFTLGTTLFCYSGLMQPQNTTHVSTITIKEIKQAAPVRKNKKLAHEKKVVNPCIKEQGAMAVYYSDKATSILVH